MEIKFRGKRVDNGEWVYGYYVVKAGMPFIFSFGVIEPILVIPETVGQYTGLNDKNKNEIYEGDIVSDRWANYYTPIFRNGIYMAYNVEHSNLKNQDPSTQFNTIWKDDNCEIIGNIHDDLFQFSRKGKI